ncbi:putative pqq enzyme repeat protein [Phaeomoniella chlamydospora]|uniref:Putative pqq enzyme repeat protein n=1 Tax=Phaeomoniella chlamydospora TaxID=158046 RepID=A0A0G2DXL0_PHACM|nr:putative pqq enzyme repeat protein [Phaeomoniella chlamydospora]
MDNGEILYTTLEPLSDEKASSVFGGIPNSEAPDGKVYSDCIKHVNPDSGEVLFQWKAIDHLDPNIFPLQPHYAREHWPLINSVYPLRDGNILASLRSVSAVIIIARDTGKVLWHLDSTVVAQQHCATELLSSSVLTPTASPSPSVNGSSVSTSNSDIYCTAGNILIFDNGAFRHHESTPFSRVIEVCRATKEILWEYRDWSMPMAFFSAFMGGAQRLPNGNTLITEAVFGRIFEVTLEGDICFEYVNDEFGSYDGVDQELVKIGFNFKANAIFRAYKYTPEQVPWIGNVG